MNFFYQLDIQNGLTLQGLFVISVFILMALGLVNALIYLKKLPEYRSEYRDFQDSINSLDINSLLTLRKKELSEEDPSPEKRYNTSQKSSKKIRIPQQQ